VASNEAARSSGFSAPVSRRQVFDALPPVSADRTYRFLSPHQAAVLDAATRRLGPTPDDDPLGLYHPGAYEAHVVTYVDRLLSRCIGDVRDQYTNGIAMLDQQAGGDFTAVPRLCQDLILSQRQVAPFTSLLFDHIIDAMYAAPEDAGRCVTPRHVNRCDDLPGGIAMA
jgi:Gluconate 2-dehydrogenase subunit 3